MYRAQNPLRGMAGGVFLIGLALAFFVADGGYFLPLLFVALAFCSLLGSMSTLNRAATYGGMQSFIWLLGLGILFLPWVGFWPWILVLCGISAILGAMAKPIMTSMPSMRTATPVYQPPQPSYQPYEQGYQAAEPTSQEGGQQYPSSRPKEEPLAQYEQPQADYPQELPPLQQQ